MRPPTAAQVVTAALASAVLLWAASPAVGIALLAWVALVPAAVVHLRAPASRAGRAVVPLTYALYLELMLVPALPFGIARDQWGTPALPVLVGDSPVLAAALVGVPLLGLVLYALRFPQPWPTLAARSGVFAVVVPALSWSALDLLRVRFDPSGIWGPLFLSQNASSPGAAVALAGPWLVTALIVGVGYTLALFLVRRRAALPAAQVMLVAILAAAIATVGLGEIEGDAVAVAVVQPGYDTSEWAYPPVRFFHPARRDDERASLEVVEDLAEPSRAAATNGAEVVAWPEAVVWVDLDESPRVSRTLRVLAENAGTSVLVPSFRRDIGLNAVAGALADGTLTGLQPKQRPMWFLGERPADRPAEPIATPVAPVGVLLGVDNQDVGSARALARRGATVLVSSTHDWRELATHQRALARVNVAAVRLPLARSDWRFGSAIFDARGRTLADAGLARSRTTLVATVQARRSDAPYLRTGDLLGWVGLAVFVGSWASALALRMRGWR